MSRPEGLTRKQRSVWNRQNPELAGQISHNFDRINKEKLAEQKLKSSVTDTMAFLFHTVEGQKIMDGTIGYITGTEKGQQLISQLREKLKYRNI